MKRFTTLTPSSTLGELRQCVFRDNQDYWRNVVDERLKTAVGVIDRECEDEFYSGGLILLLSGSTGLPSTILLRSHFSQEGENDEDENDESKSLTDAGIEHGSIVEAKVDIDEVGVNKFISCKRATATATQTNSVTGVPPPSPTKATTNQPVITGSSLHSSNSEEFDEDKISSPGRVKLGGWEDADEALARALIESDINGAIPQQQDQYQNRNTRQQDLPRPPDAPVRERLIGNSHNDALSTMMNTNFDDIISMLNSRVEEGTSIVQEAARRNEENRRRVEGLGASTTSTTGEISATSEALAGTRRNKTRSSLGRAGQNFASQNSQSVITTRDISISDNTSRNLPCNVTSVGDSRPLNMMGTNDIAAMLGRMEEETKTALQESVFQPMASSLNEQLPNHSDEMQRAMQASQDEELSRLGGGDDEEEMQRILFAGLNEQNFQGIDGSLNEEKQLEEAIRISQMQGESESSCFPVPVPVPSNLPLSSSSQDLVDLTDSVNSTSSASAAIAGASGLVQMLSLSEEDELLQRALYQSAGGGVTDEELLAQVLKESLES